MKWRFGLAAWIVAAALACSQAGFAQGPGGRRGISPADAAQRLADRLDLTDQQEATVQSYFEDQRSQLQALRSDTTLTRDQKMQQMRTIMQQTRDKVQALLTPEQQQKQQELRAHAQQRAQARAQQRFDRMARLLDLTPDQKTQMQSYLDNQRTQLQALRTDSSLTPEQRREQARTIHEQTRSNIQALLDPTQQQKLKDLRATQRGRRGRRRGGPWGGPGGPGGPGA